MNPNVIYFVLSHILAISSLIRNGGQPFQFDFFLQVAEESTTVIEALNKFVNDRVSALPIVSADGRLTNIYSKFDVINLAATKTYSDLEITLEEATQHKIHFDGVYGCKGDNFAIFVKMVNSVMLNLFP